MRATSIRYTNGSKLTQHQLQSVCDVILSRTSKAGFITQAQVINGSCIKIGLHMSSFRVNTQQLGHNARIGRYIESPKGYKRTDVPTWDQRVEFNNLVNQIFDDYKLVARITSGPFTVRDRTQGACDEQDWINQAPSYMGSDSALYNGLGELISLIVSEREAREQCDSDRLEAEYQAAQKIENREKSKERRAILKVFKQSKKVTVDGFYDDKRNGKQMTHKAFDKMLSKLNSWQKRRVKKATIAKTIIDT